MPSSDPFQRICDDFELLAIDLKVIVQSDLAPSDDKLIALAFLQTIGSCFVSIGNAMESGDTASFSRGLAEAEKISKQARETTLRHPLLGAAR